MGPASGVLGAMAPRQEKAKVETPRSEDYLEEVYHLVQEKGFAVISDISARLDVKPPTVSDMVTKLTRKGYLRHERYRGMTLTAEGERLAKSVIKRHSVISQFLAMLGVDDPVAYQDTEGIEHHVHPATLRRIERAAEYLKENPRVLRALRDYVDSG